MENSQPPANMPLPSDPPPLPSVAPAIPTEPPPLPKGPRPATRASMAFPPPPVKRAKSFFHHAADASVIAILINFIFRLLTIPLPKGDPATNALVNAIGGGVGILLFVIGILSGIVAFFGIPRYGARGILVKALCGTVIPIGLLLLAIPAILGAISRGEALKQAQGNIEQQLHMHVDKLNADGPVPIDEITVRTGAEVLPNRTLAYDFTISSDNLEGISSQQLIDAIRPAVVQQYRDGDDSRAFRENGVILLFRYRDQQGNSLAEFTVGPEDLNK